MRVDLLLGPEGRADRAELLVADASHIDQEMLELVRRYGRTSES